MLPLDLTNIKYHIYLTTPLSYFIAIMKSYAGNIAKIMCSGGLVFPFGLIKSCKASLV
jgi:hypothetical protein